MKIIILEFKTGEVFIYYIPSSFMYNDINEIFDWLKDEYDIVFNLDDIQYMITSNKINIK